MPDIIRLAKTLKRHIDGILEARLSGMNPAVVEGLNNKIRTAFERSFALKAQKYRDAFIYLVEGGLRLPPRMLDLSSNINLFRQRQVSVGNR